MPSTPTHSVLRPHGIIIVTDVEGKSYQADCLTCMHCRKAWVVRPGSGIRRGWCHKCSGPTCGCAACDTCLSAEKRLDLYEAGKIDFI